MAKTVTILGGGVTAELMGIGTDTIVLGLRDTDYRLYLVVDGPVTAPLNKLVTGCITARARRVDVVRRGGRYIEPVYGRPRRLQGTVVGVDGAANALAVRCGGGATFVCTLMSDQAASDFQAGILVAFDIEPCAKFVMSD